MVERASGLTSKQIDAPSKAPKYKALTNHQIVKFRARLNELDRYMNAHADGFSILKARVKTLKVLKAFEALLRPLKD